MEELARRISERGGSMVLLKDRVASKGSFVLHFLLRKLLSDTGTRVVLLGLSEPFAHYNRIARKQGCNLQAWRDKGRFVFVELSPELLEYSSVDHSERRTTSGDISDGTSGEHSLSNALAGLYSQIRAVAKGMRGTGESGEQRTCIMVDDTSVLDVVAGGSQNAVLDFLHYCQTLSCGKQRCSLVILTHQDIYEEPADSKMGLELEHASDTIVNVEPLSTGLAVDVHGQLTISHRTLDFQETPVSRLHRFQFRILENTVQFFLPGQL